MDGGRGRVRRLGERPRSELKLPKMPTAGAAESHNAVQELNPSQSCSLSVTLARVSNIALILSQSARENSCLQIVTSAFVALRMRNPSHHPRRVTSVTRRASTGIRALRFVLVIAIPESSKVIERATPLTANVIAENAPNNASAANPIRGSRCERARKKEGRSMIHPKWTKIKGSRFPLKLCCSFVVLVANLGPPRTGSVDAHIAATAKRTHWRNITALTR